MSTLGRYTVLHLPGWAGAGVVVALCWELGFISARTAAGLFVLWFLKDVVAYPLVRKAYEDRRGTRIEDLVGSCGGVQRDLAPVGFVRIRGELWRAELANGASPVAAGSIVIVRGARGLTLVVEEVRE
jgi:membrane-bound serine protease (ClpP class)